MSRFHCIIVLLVLTAQFGLTGQLWASGFGVFTQGAAGMAEANAVVAHASGPSSLYFNPALLPQVPGTALEIGTTMIIADREFTSALDGQTTSNRDSAKFPSTFYLSQQFSPELAGGIGLFFPFGLATEWADDWDGRYIATRSELFSTCINPALAWQPIPQLAMAAGVDIVYVDAELQRKLNATFLNAALSGTVVPLPDINQSFTGNDWGAGYNLGLFLQISRQVDFGASYRSHIDLQLDGQASFSVPPGSAGLAPLLPASGGEAGLRLPAQAAFGLAWRTTPRLTLEAGARWEQWSSFRELNIALNPPVLGQTADVTPREWDDTWAFNLGGDYQLNERVTLRAGYLFGDNPVPDSTFDPSLPDSDFHTITLGAGVRFGRYLVDLAYGFEHHERRTKDNSVGDRLDPGGLNPASFANGSYSTDIHLLAVSVGYRF